jgi:hypothetical protein
MKEADKDEDNLIDFEEFSQVNHHVMQPAFFVCYLLPTASQGE